MGRAIAVKTDYSGAEVRRLGKRTKDAARIAATARSRRGANGALNGGPQMVEISRNGRRVYFTNSLYGAIDPQFYPESIDGWMAKLDGMPEGGIAFAEKFFVQWPGPHRPHQVRLEGGDCSSDFYCYP